MHTILIIDDDAALREGLSEAIRDLGYGVVAAASGREALALAAHQQPDAALLDLRMPDCDGLDVLRQMREQPAAPPIAILTAYATAANTIEAMRLGAFDHLTKPVGRDDLAALLGRMLRTGHRSTTSAAADGAGADDTALIGLSATMRAVQKMIGLVADSDATVLIGGETGTGKEVVARTIHRVGARRGAPFVALNCAAIPADLLESELFGHVKGAFTGAISERRGAFRDADGGVLFLDEIGDMDLAMQAKILRAIQERVVTPVGGRAQPIDVRIIAATHRDLGSWVRAGRFREDLFYRLNVVPIDLAPLRDRPDDILPLARHFLARSVRPGLRLSDEASTMLGRHAWPGNVRELKNAMDRVVVMCRGDLVTASDLAFLVASSAVAAGQDSSGRHLAAAVENLERRMVSEALAATRGNRAEAARRLGIHRQLLHAKAEKYGLGRRASTLPHGDEP